jgi:tetratricopeptide (TPR) repeat protein
VPGLVLCCLGHVLVLYGRPEEAVAAHREALQLCRDYGAVEDVCRSCLIFSSDLSQCSRYDEAERLAADGIVFAVKTGHMNFYGIGIASNRIGALLKAGRWREAERVYSQFDDRVPETVTWRHGPWLYVLLGQGRVREARAIVDVLREDTADADVPFGAEMLVRAGELADLEERWDQARDLFRRGLEPFPRHGRPLHHQPGMRQRHPRRAATHRIHRRPARSRRRDSTRPPGRGPADRRARDLAARFPTNGFALLPEPAAWLQTAEGECAAVWGQDTAEIWADLAATGGKGRSAPPRRSGALPGSRRTASPPRRPRPGTALRGRGIGRRGAPRRRPH